MKVIINLFPSKTARLTGLGGEWLLDISIPDRYPYVPPDMKFVTPICHPNVHFKVP